jgi:hypothetical protein
MPVVPPVSEPSVEHYEAPAVEVYEEEDSWTFAPCGGD